MLIVITGDGKGKTTAAIGQAIRALGHGKKVFFVQFIKCDGYPSGEDDILRGFAGKLTYLKGGKGFVGIMGDALPFEEHRAAARAALEAAEKAARSGAYDLFVLDEANVALSLKLLELSEVMKFLDLVHNRDVVMTGRHASAEIVARADFVTECRAVKHPFENKVPAKAGLEY